MRKCITDNWNKKIIHNKFNKASTVYFLNFHYFHF